MGVIALLSGVVFPLVIILCSSSLSDSSFVFTEYINYTGLDDSQPSTLPLVVIIGTLTAPIALVGYEAAATMAEETIDGASAAPTSMIRTILISGVSSLMLIISMLYACRGSVDGVLAGPTLQTAVNLFAFVFTKSSGDEGMSNSQAPIEAIFLTIIYVLVNFGNGFSHFTVTTRIGYALARDDALPGSKWLKKLNNSSKNPDRVTIAVLVLEGL